ncbi:trypsin-3-like [Thrips palmi]|uniref:trypsin n=1 Tax=Thrips palmi TaxID=161013 RepID=A0A6P8ZPZ4_THRPL|nr:trypsin-3-like [Thrips palmi]
MLLRESVILLCALAGALSVPARLRRGLDVGLQIIGGDTADIADFPYQVSMEKYGEHDCGGSILNKQWILTAAHCLYSSVKATDVGVRYGTSTQGQGGTLLAAKFVGYHDKYVHDLHQHDVGLIQVDKDIVFSLLARPIAMVDVDAEIDSSAVLMASGWGTLHSGDWEGPTQLYAVLVPYVPRATCRVSYGWLGKVVDDSMICAGVSGKDTCQGDSGGPLVNDLGIQVGVVSWGHGCGSPGFPGIYADLANEENRKWITDTSGVA